MSSKLSRSSDKTTNKNNEDSYSLSNPPTIFTPPDKSNTVRAKHRRNRSQRDKQSQNNSYEENDSTSSPKPLCTNLENERLQNYEKENMSQLDMEEMQDAKKRGRQINNDSSINAVKSQNLNDDSEKISNVSPFTNPSEFKSRAWKDISPIEDIQNNKRHQEVDEKDENISLTELE